MTRQPEIIIDCFAGGGGASTGFEMALGRSPDGAVNHNKEALAMHKANHPRTRHYETDVFEVDPNVVARGRPVGAAWFSPDCTFFSKSRGGKPIRENGKKIRALAWVVVKWAKTVRPRVIFLENVEEFADWGPVIQKVGDDGEPVFTSDGSPWYVPCPKRKGQTFQKWVGQLKLLGYAVEWKELRACDYGAPTIRKRLFLIARCDGKPIVWPKPTHGDPKSAAVQSGKLPPWRTAAEIIDWTIPCPSIFLTPEEAKPLGLKRPLKPATMARIARGMYRFVINNPDPFIVYGNHSGEEFRGRSVNDPMATLTSSRDAVGIVDPFVQKYHGGPDSAQRTFGISEPLLTADTANRFGVVAPIISRGQHGGGERPANSPMHTITASRKDQNQVIAPYLVPRYGEHSKQKPRVRSTQDPLATIVTSDNGSQIVAPVLNRSPQVSAFLAQHNTGVTGHPTTRPLSTLTQRCTQQQVVSAELAPAPTAGYHVAQVMAFLQLYYGQGSQDQDCRRPARTIPTKDRLGLVKVDQVDYQIVDIGMRMFTPRELFNAQGFRTDYKLRVLCDYTTKQGKTVRKYMPKSSLVRLCGNSVSPNMACALIKANVPELRARGKKQQWQPELLGV